MEYAISDMKHTLNGAVSVEDKQQDPFSKEVLNAFKEEGSSDLWSDFKNYYKTPLIQPQCDGIFCGLPAKEENESLERSSLQQSSKVPNDVFKNHYCLPGQGCKLECDKESNLFVSAANDSGLKWTSECNCQLVKATFQTDCNEAEPSDFGAAGILLPVASPLAQDQQILSANSVSKADAQNLVENIFQNSFPSEPVCHVFEDFPVLEKTLEINEESDPNKATSCESGNLWKNLQDLNKVALRSSWNVLHTREKLLSTLGVDQNQQTNRQADQEDDVGSHSDLEKTEELLGVAALPDNSSKALIQTRISVTPSQRASHGFSHHLETVFMQWMQMNGCRGREAPRIKRHSWFT
ncbi:uncharacterized protein [Narcine bancroftii]|uniref:uncharacterized protein isoform X2 n=1 Tax=Narcine bancroftii TaxID=1343680 RepID=UPI0038314865